MRVAFAGNTDRGVVCLEALLNSKHKVEFVLAHPGESSVQRLAESKQIPHLQPSNPNTPEVHQILSRIQPDLLILVGYSKILKKETFSIPKFGSINLHAGPLPYYRGAAPLNWMLINGEKEAGISILRVDEGIDTGDILAQSFFPIGPNDSIVDLVRTTNSLYPKMLLNVLNDLEHDTLQAQKQNPIEGSHFTKRHPEDGFIQWDQMTSGEIHNLTRALTFPYPGAFTYYQGKKIYILETKFTQGLYKGIPGRIALRREGGVVVIARDQGIVVTRAATQSGLDFISEAASILPSNGKTFDRSISHESTIF